MAGTERKVEKVSMPKIILVACFIISAIVIIMPLIAERQFNMGQFEEAIKIEPFSARYIAEYGNYLFKKSFEVKEKIDLLNDAERLLIRAVQLNPISAEYYLMLGQIQISLFLEDKEKFPEKFKTALDNFKTAFHNDPNGFNTSYSIGYAGIAVWEFLDKEEKDFILSRLKYSLKLKPSYSKYIYPKLWNETSDLNLLRRIEPPGKEPNWYIARLERLEMMRATAKRTLNVASVVIESDWQGRADDRKNVYVNGNMYWAGTIDAAIRVPRGKATIRIKAKGSPADNIYPYMKVELGGKEIGTVTVNSLEWKQYDFKVNTDGGIKALSITFVNDGTNPVKGEDRNLYIGHAEAI